MKNATYTRVAAILSAVVLAASLSAACSGKDTPPAESGPSAAGMSSSAVGTEPSGNASGTGGTAAEGSGAPSGSTLSLSGGPAASAPGKNSTAQAKPGPASAPGKTNATQTKPPVQSSGKVDPAKYRGTTVRYATWKDPFANEDGPVVTSFEKKYGIKVQIDITPQTNYIQTITGKIAAGDSPDICFDNNEFPASLSILQPLAASQVDLSDPIWDPGMIELSSIGGKPYLLNTIGNIWAETDLVFFNKKLLKANGIHTPDDYYKNGTWNYAAMKKVMEETKALGEEYYGGYLDERILSSSLKADFFQLKNGRFTNGTSNPMLTNVYKYIAECNKAGLLCTSRDPFIKGKAGIFVTNAFGLKKTGYWADMNPNDIGFTYLPDWDAKTKAVNTSLFRGWGIIKGSKNPVAAGIFLRHYLDVSNYDTRKAFISAEAETFFFKLTAANTKDKQSYLLRGVCKIIGKEEATFSKLAKVDPAQVAQQIASSSSVVEAGVKKVNAFFDEQAKLYK